MDYKCRKRKRKVQSKNI